jgi:hypothetical protein
MKHGIYTAMALWAVCATPAMAGDLQSYTVTSPGASMAAGGDESAYLPSSPQVEQQVEARLRDSLSAEMLQNFGLFVYVSKAEVGPWAQRMFVFQKIGDDLLMLYDWPVSTGRETVEANPAGVQLPTNTPAGYYELDPKRIFAGYHSSQWDEDMPYAMFFNWVDHGAPTGLAIHGTSAGGEGLLGMRASAGCVRLSKDNARTLFNIVRENFKGLAPKFAFDKYSNTLMNNGLLLHDAEGNVELVPGYSVLVYIDDFGGESLEAQAY